MSRCSAHKMGLLIAVFLLATGSICQARSLNTDITNFPPFYIVSKDGKASGLYHDLMLKIATKAGYQPKVHTFPTKRLYRNLGNGTSDVFLGIKGSPEYHGHVHYSKVPLSQIQLRAYAVGDTPLPTSKEQLNGHKIAIMRGYGYGGMVNYFYDRNNDIDTKAVTEHRASFMMLKKNRVDYVINYKYPSDQTLKNIEIPELKFSSLYSADVFIIVSKRTPNAEKVIAELEAAYLTMLESGEAHYIENTTDEHYVRYR